MRHWLPFLIKFVVFLQLSENLDCGDSLSNLVSNEVAVKIQGLSI